MFYHTIPYHHRMETKILYNLNDWICSKFWFLALSMKTLPMGFSYAVWTGIGTIGGTIVGMLFYGEKKDWKRVSFIGLILAAVIGLKLTS